MRFCIKCGSGMPDGARFCSVCGTDQTIPQQPQLDQQTLMRPTQQAQTAQPQQFQQPMQPAQQYGQQPMPQQFGGMPMNGFNGMMKPKKSKKKLIIILSIVMVLVIAAAIILPINLSAKASSKRAVKRYFAGISNQDYSKFKSVLLPDDAKSLQDSIDSYYGGDGSKYMKSRYGNIENLSWSIMESREFSDEELQSANSYLSKYYNCTASKAFSYTIKVTWQERDGDYLEERQNQGEFAVIKVNGKWYIADT